MVGWSRSRRDGLACSGDLDGAGWNRLGEGAAVVRGDPTDQSDADAVAVAGQPRGGQQGTVGAGAGGRPVPRQDPQCHHLAAESKPDTGLLSRRALRAGAASGRSHRRGRLPHRQHVATVQFPAEEAAKSAGKARPLAAHHGRHVKASADGDVPVGPTMKGPGRYLVAGSHRHLRDRIARDHAAQTPPPGPAQSWALDDKLQRRGRGGVAGAGDWHCSPRSTAPPSGTPA